MLKTILLNQYMKGRRCFILLNFGPFPFSSRMLSELVSSLMLHRDEYSTLYLLPFFVLIKSFDVRLLSKRLFNSITPSMIVLDVSRKVICLLLVASFAFGHKVRNSDPAPSLADSLPSSEISEENATAVDSVTGAEGNGTSGIDSLVPEKPTVWEPKKAYETYLKHHERHQDHLATSDSKIRVANDHLDAIHHKLFHHEVRNELLNLAVKNSSDLQIDNIRNYIETVVAERFSRFLGKPRKGAEAAVAEPARDCLVCPPSGSEPSHVGEDDESTMQNSTSANVTEAEDYRSLANPEKKKKKKNRNGTNAARNSTNASASLI